MKIVNKLFRFLIGCILIALGVCSAIFSTYATIIPITMSFRSVTQTIMIGIFIIVQISVFFLAMTKNYIAKETPQHYLLINRIANILLIVSIVSTITFFTINKHNVAGHKDSIIDLYKVIPFMERLPFYDWVLGITINFVFIWAICIILDLLAIKMPIIGFDVIMGIQEKQVYNTLISKLIAIVTYKPKMWIETKYNSLGLESINQISGPEDEKFVVKVFDHNVDQFDNTEIKEKETKLIESAKADPQEKLFEKKVLNLENLQKVFNFIIENMSGENVAPGMKRTSDNTDIEYSEIVRIWEELKKYGYLEPDKVNKRTLVLKEQLNLNDFDN